ncbi:MAG: Maf family protein [Magnetococcus sp. YQC-3]
MESMSSICWWLQDRRIRLASASPRRLRLLQQVGIHPEVHPADLDETRWPEEPVAGYVQRMAIAKATHHPATDIDLVIAADTIVVVDETLLGKPANASEAAEMLAQIAGRAHRVLTAVAVFQPATRRCLHQVVESHVWIKPLSREEVIAYVATGEPLDKAGAYGIQGVGAALVARLDGSCSGVAGLPLCETLALLREFT